MNMICTAAILLSIPSFVPTEDVAHNEVDLMEVNHFYNEQGEHVFDQVIFYDWSATDSRYEIRAWRLVKDAAQRPLRNWETGAYEAVWQDGDLMRRVRAAAFRETWTQYDPELEHRQQLPKHERRELHRPAVPIASTP